ncbi:hypothetical protein D3C80_2091690 [compost metagenome]
MVFVKAIFIEDRAGDVSEPMAGLPTFIAKSAQGHQEDGIGARLGGVATAREQQ